MRIIPMNSMEIDQMKINQMKKIELNEYMWIK